MLADIYALARVDLLAYTALVSPWYRVGAMHHLLADELMRFADEVMAGRSPRLIIETPPRHGKTELSRHFLSWFLGRNPSAEAIVASYSAELAEEHGRNVRELMGDEVYRAMFPGVGVTTDSRAVNRFHIEGGDKKGVFVGVGVGGSATGRGAHVLLVDDAYKGREQADSAAVRRKTNSWYDSVARTRIMDGGGVLLVNTRWHQGDLVGHVEEKWGHEGWRKVTLPAISDGPGDLLGREFGAALWPERYTAQSLDSLRQGMTDRDWLSIFQQRPPAEAGAYFDVDKVTDYARAPSGLIYVGAGDEAVTEDDGDWTELAIVGIDHESHWWVVDWWSGQATADIWTERKIDLMERYKPALWLSEGGVIRNATEPYLRRRMAERGVPCRLEWLPSIGDKPARARAAQAAVSMGWVHVPAGKPWIKKLLEQMKSFPAGVYDDCVDVLGLVGRGMAEFGRGLRPPAPKIEAPRLPPNTLRARDIDRTVERRRSRYAA